MPPQTTAASRKPTPKERGCFQCSRRRIICDKAEPECGKCVKKGIVCSGVNRIRFTGSVARRGQLKGLEVPDDRVGAGRGLPGRTGFAEVRWVEMKGKEQGADEGKETNVGRLEALSETLSSPSQNPSNSGEMINPENALEEPQHTNSTLQPHSTHSTHTTPQPWLAPIDASTRLLFAYFSTTIAPVMVVLDTPSNGYREVILPMALSHPVLRRAVGVVAAQHLSRSAPQIRDAAETCRSGIIAHLREQSLTASEDQVFDQVTWATLIVLLVGETVTGSPACGNFISMLLCLAENSRVREERSDVVKFLQTQTNMFELLGMPLAGEHSGIAAIKKSFKKWQHYLMQVQCSEDSMRMLSQVRLCFDAACSIYVRRATSHPSLSHSSSQTSTLQDLIHRLSLISPHSHGAHALVWPCFIGGAEASEPDHRAFFVSYMWSVYAKTGFGNIPVAVKGLEELWEGKKAGRRWTECLREFSDVLVM